MLRKNCFVGALCFLNILLISNSNGQLLVDQLRWDFLNLEEKLWQYVLEQSKYGFNDTDDPGVALITVFHNYDRTLQKMPQDILYGMEVTRQSPAFLFLYADFRVIADMYDKFSRFLSNSLSKDNNNVSVVDERETRMSHIIEEVLYDPNTNINKTISNIFKETFLRGDNENLLSSILDEILNNNYVCKHFKEIPQQVFYNLYNVIALVQLKGYVMMQFSYMAQRLIEEGNFTQESLAARKQFEKTTVDMFATLKTTMSVMPRETWRCDPRKHEKGSTYEELTGLIQGHIENEVDMNYDGTCKQNCGAYSYTDSYGCYDSKSDYCTRRKPCTGKIIGCRFVESHMTACFSPSYSSRRYEYIEYKSGKRLGKKQYCQQRSINSWFRWFVHCSYCLCLCDQEGPRSDRYFNLRPVMSDVANNRVVTGLRIVKKNRLIHLQIQEGKLLPYGYIDSSTIRWVPVDDYKITDPGIMNSIDFHTMNYGRRTMFLDHLTSHETDHIITGVRFEFIDNHLKFQINVRKFDFDKGILSNDSYYIHGSDSRQQINIIDADIPINSPPSEPNFDINRYIEFTHTSFDKDAAQTTVPFFDMQPVNAYPAVPLRGAGLYYKGQNGYGGFVAPKISAYDFSKRMSVDFPEINMREDSRNEFPILA